LIEDGVDGIVVKFIKNKFQYELDEMDEIYLKGDIENYA